MILRQRIILLAGLVLLGTFIAVVHRSRSAWIRNASTDSPNVNEERRVQKAYSWSSLWESKSGENEDAYSTTALEALERYPGLRQGIRDMRDKCTREQDFFLSEYGRANIRLTRSYTGSLFRINRFLSRSLLSASSALHASSSSESSALDSIHTPVISVLGGSVSGGFGVQKEEIWHEKFGSWFDGLVEGSGSERVNGAVPATGSDYFSFCSHLHIPLNSTLIFIELSINDEYLPEHTENMENLLRSLLDLPGKPAVVMIQALELNSGMMRNGGDVHLPVAVYYDVPVLSQRNALGPHFMRHPDLIHPFFSVNYWQDADLRHINVRGHRDLGAIAQSLFADAACELVDGSEAEVVERVLGYAMSLDKDEVAGDESGAGEDTMDLAGAMPKHVRPWGPWKKPHDEAGTERTWRGVWGPEKSMGQLPRLRFSQQWHETQQNVPLQPQCFSTRSLSHPLTPTRSSGWSSWSSPERPDKTYLFANVTGSTFEYDIETRMGTVKMYSLRSKTFGLGSVWCWVDGDEEGGVRADGWWDNGAANIGRFTTIKTGLQPGKHTVHCRLLEDTLDPGGGHEFRIISLMSL